MCFHVACHVLLNVFLFYISLLEFLKKLTPYICWHPNLLTLKELIPEPFWHPKNVDPLQISSPLNISNHMSFYPLIFVDHNPPSTKFLHLHLYLYLKQIFLDVIAVLTFGAKHLTNLPTNKLTSHEPNKPTNQSTPDPPNKPTNQPQTHLRWLFKFLKVDSIHLSSMSL